MPSRGADVWQILWNEGDGTFGRGPFYSGGNHCHSVGVADWDGDQDLDVVSGFAVSQEMYYYEHGERIPTADIPIERSLEICASLTNHRVPGLHIQFSKDLEGN